MKGKRFSEEQIIKILQEVTSGMPLADVCRNHGVSQQSYYRWKAKYGGMEASDTRRLRHLEDENARLKHIVADQALDIRILRDVNAKKW